MSDTPLSESFEGTVSDPEELDELWGKVEAFAGTLAAQFDGDIRIEFEVAPVLEPTDEDP